MTEICNDAPALALSPQDSPPSRLIPYPLPSPLLQPGGRAVRKNRPRPLPPRSSLAMAPHVPPVPWATTVLVRFKLRATE